MGNVGQHPEILTLDSGKRMAKFSIATNSFYKNAKGEKVEDTQWHNIIAWGNTVDIIEKYVEKGKQIGIKGKLTSNSYDAEDGSKRYFTQVVCNEILLMGK